MGLFLDLLLAHLLGDFVLQSGGMVAAKREGVKGQLVHVCIVTAVTAMAVLSLWPGVAPLVAAVALAHLVIERLTIWAREALDARGLFVFVFDQSLHILSLLAVAAMAPQSIADASPTAFGLTVGLPVLAAVCGLLTVCFMGSILAFEAARAAVPPAQDDEGLLSWDVERALGLVERGAAYGLAFALGPGAMLAPFLPRVAVAWASPPRTRAVRLVEAVSGLALCALSYAAFVAVVAFARTLQVR